MSLSVRVRAQSNNVVILIEVDSVVVFLHRPRNAELWEEIAKYQVQVEDMIRPTDDVLIRDGQLVQHDRASSATRRDNKVCTIEDNVGNSSVRMRQRALGMMAS